jgi:hypothetical protein
MSHKFNVDQAVVFTPGAGEVISLAAPAIVIRLLPVDGAECQYQIQADADGLCGGVGKVSFGLDEDR